MLRKLLKLEWWWSLDFVDNYKGRILIIIEYQTVQTLQGCLIYTHFFFLTWEWEHLPEKEKNWILWGSSVQFNCSVMSDSLRPHESQHTRPPCPSPPPRVHSDSHPSCLWCHPAISSSVVPFSSCPQSLPASESFPMSQFFAWGGQSNNTLKVNWPSYY